MKYVSITTPDNIQIEYRLAGIGSRLAAFSVDFTVLILIFILQSLIIFFPIFKNPMFFNEISDVYTAIIIISYFIVYMGYFVVIEIITNGQSIGKKILKLRVIKDNGKAINIGGSIIRNLFKIIIDVTGVGVVLIMVTKNHKRIGDIVCGTIVVAENKDKVQILTLEKEEDNNTIISQEILDNEIFKKLKEHEDYSKQMIILKEYFLRKDNLKDDGKTIYEELVLYFTEIVNYIIENNEIDDKYKNIVIDKNFFNDLFEFSKYRY